MTSMPKCFTSGARLAPKEDKKLFVAAYVTPKRDALLASLEATFWMGEYVTLGEEEECQAFGDDPTAKYIDLDVLLAEALS